jgi:Zn-dependent peptidase ImmA (M78 family)
MKIFEVADPIHRQLPDFIKFACDELGIKEPPTIDVVDSVPDASGTTFGQYNPTNQTIYLVARGRHPKDVFRTLAHELVHFTQDQQDRLHTDSGATGSQEENQANAQAGVVMRNYSEQNPE